MPIQNTDEVARRDWMGVLARAEYKTLNTLWDAYENKPEFKNLRKPESGLVMIRGRMGGAGKPFNLGEATVTRCSVRPDNGAVGHAYILGRNRGHAQCAAEIDALMQDEQHQDALNKQIIEPLRALHHRQSKIEQEKTAATKVDFFTLVRGEDD